MPEMHLMVGTSGFSYKEWKGPFYPEDLPAKRMLSYYATRLPAVEINNTFYRLPKASVLETWRDSVGAHFRFVLKVSRRITHQHRLKDCEDPVQYLLETSEVLGERRGPFLLQLPPFLRLDLDRLESFLETWPRSAAAAFEFRHPSWFCDETYALLEQAGAALCVADNGSEDDAPLRRTASWTYLRLRRPGYDDAALDDWARRVRDLGVVQAYAFFKHEDAGAGPRLALRFEERLAELG